MKRKLLVLALAISVFVLLGFSFAFGQDTGNPDTVWVERIDTVLKSHSYVVNVYLYNDEETGGFTIPLAFPDSLTNLDVTCDSVSLVGTRSANADGRGLQESISNAKNRVNVWAVWLFATPILQPISYANAKTTPLAKIFFHTGSSWSDVPPAQSVPLDTTIWPPVTHLEVTGPLGTGFTPYFYKGALDVTEIPTSSSLPTAFALYQNYPNPFNATTTIEFDNPKTQPVKVVILNILGQTVETLLEKELEQKRYRIDWNASGLSSGPYFCRIQAGKEIKVMKVTLLK
ncbi:MAG: T9SS type A sorting domain-containing protein [candidate division Zixibacteria bacterium]|nr:T9SS type A sorting domain-containing protein [candidate division Zixibacteria bacterium]